MKRINILIALILILSTVFSTSVYATPVVLPDDPLHGGLSGDVNENGVVDSMDYIMTKRCVMGTYVLSSAKEKLADVDGSGTITVVDYVVIKRRAMEQ